MGIAAVIPMGRANISGMLVPNRPDGLGAVARGASSSEFRVEAWKESVWLERVGEARLQEELRRVLPTEDDAVLNMVDEQ